MSYIQKIALLVFCLPTALFPLFIILYGIFWENARFENTMLIPIGMTLLGICSFIFQLKSLKTYRLYKTKKSLPRIEPIIYWLNIAFAGSLILAVGFMVVMLLRFESINVPVELILIIFGMMLMGSWILAEAIYFNRLLKGHKLLNRYSEIDEIRGNSI